MLVNLNKFTFLATILCYSVHTYGTGNSPKIKKTITRTSIVTYKKQNTSKEDIHSLFNKLKNDSSLSVEHLPNFGVEHLQNVGAFLITFHSLNQTAASKSSLLKMVSDYKMNYYENGFFTDSEDQPDQTIPPNDINFKSQWALQKLNNQADINAQEGWKEYLSATNNGGRMNTKEVIVAVIDTGVRYDHEDLKDIMWKNPGEIEGNGIDDDGNGFVDDVFGINTITNSSDPMDVPGFRAGHGTHCAGIIAAKENNGKGIAGLVP